MSNKKEKYVKQLEDILSTHKEFRLKSKYQDLSDLPKEDRKSLITKAIAAAERISGNDSIYSKEMLKIIENKPELHLHTSEIMGIVKGLKDDIESENMEIKDESNPFIIAAGAGAGGGGGGGGGPGGGRGGDGGSVIIGIPPEQVTIRHVKNPHKQYWKMLLSSAWNWINENKIIAGIIVVVVGGVVLAYLVGWIGLNN